MPLTLTPVHRRWPLALLGGCALASAMSARADEAAPEPAAEAPSRFAYQVGLAASYKPTYTGSDRMDWGVRPVVGLRWGRLRLTSSQANLIDGLSDGSRAAGASYTLVDSARWTSGVALRFDNGRSSGDDPRLAGLPDVRATVRARVYGRYSFDASAVDQRAVGATLSTDLLGRGGGVTASLDLSRRVRLTPSVQWTHGIGVGAGNATNLMSYVGVPAASAAVSGLPAYTPGAGLTDVHLGTGLTWLLHPRWRIGGAVNASHFLGPVADSPLTLRSGNWGVVFGLVYISGQD